MAAYDSKVVTGERLSQTLEKVRNELSFRVGFCNCENSGTSNEAMSATLVSTNGKSFELKSTGVVVAVYFSTALGANSTLNINGTGAKAVYAGGAAVEAGKVSGGLVLLRYDGTKYNVVASGGRAVQVGDTVRIPATSTETLVLNGGGATAVTWDTNNKKVVISTDISGKQDKIKFGSATSGAVTNLAAGTNMTLSISGNTATINFGQGYGICSTAAATAAKVVALTGYTLTTGGMVAVKFTYAVPANATLNVESKGAKNIRYNGSNITGDVIKAGDIALFEYDGTYYNLILSSPGNISKAINDINSSISNIEEDLEAINDRIDASEVALTIYYGTTTTAEATTEKAVTCNDFTIAVGRMIAINFQNAVLSNQTLNVNSTGAKPIKWGNSSVSALTGYINAGDTCLFRFDGTNYVLLCNSYKFPGFNIGPNVTSSGTTNGEWYEDPDGMLHGRDKINGSDVDIIIPPATTSNHGVMKILQSIDREYEIGGQTVTKTLGNVLINDGKGGILLPVAGSGDSNTIGAVAPGVGVSVGEGGHLELNQADANNIGGMKLSNTISDSDLAKTDTTLTASATSRLIAREIGDAQVGAAMFQGTVGTNAGDVRTPDNGNTPFNSLTDYKKGQYWVVATAGTYTGTAGTPSTGGKSCEVGDFIFCVTDKGNGTYNPDHFTVVQNNMETITESEINTMWSTVFG